MNFLSIFSMILTLARPAVLTIEALHGEAVAKVDKGTMAQTALLGGLHTALGVLPDGDQAFATRLAGLVSAGIKAAVDRTKATGEYQAATAASLNLPAPAPAPAV